jgi:hypothetical protein
MGDEWVPWDVPKESLAAAFDSQKFFLEATAGLRGQWLKTAKALGKNNDHLMEKWIVDAFNTARGNEETVFKVVQGRWEGYFGLVSAYLHAANPAKHVGKVLNCADGDGGKFCEKEMVYFEVGGASQQIAFAQCSKAEITADKTILEKGWNKYSFLEVGAKTSATGPMHMTLPKSTLKGFQSDCKKSDGDKSTFDIYSRSWLGDGMDRLDAGLVSVLFKRMKPFDKDLKMACWKKGVEVSMGGDDKLVFAQNEHVAWGMGPGHQALKELHPNKITPKQPFAKGTYARKLKKGMKIVGTGNYEKCYRDINAWLDRGLDETRPNPGFGYASQIEEVAKLIEEKAKSVGGRKNLKWVISSMPLSMAAFPFQHFNKMSVAKANKCTDTASQKESCDILVESGIAKWVPAPKEGKKKCQPTRFGSQSQLITMKNLRRFAKWACKDKAPAHQYSYAQCKMATFFDVVLRKFGICKGQTECSKFMVNPMDWTEGAAKMHADHGEAGMFDFNHNNKNENADVVA